MKYYPVNLDIRGRRCLVVGGGSVSTRKVKALLGCGAIVEVVATDVSSRLCSLSEEGLISLARRPYGSSDLAGAFLVIGATDDEALNAEISRDAERTGVLCNIADRPEACSFILPAVVNRGDLVIAVSTSGKSPAFAKKLRQDLEAEFGEEYGEFLLLMGAVRSRLLEQDHEPESHKGLFEALISSGLLEMVRGRAKGDIDSLLERVLGEGYTYDSLMESGSQRSPQ